MKCIPSHPLAYQGCHKSVSFACAHLAEWIRRGGGYDYDCRTAGFIRFVFFMDKGKTLILESFLNINTIIQVFLCMNPEATNISRRQLLSRIGMTAVAGGLAGAIRPPPQMPIRDRSPRH